MKREDFIPAIPAPIVEGKCPPEINPETGQWYYPEPGTKRTAKRLINGIDVDEVLAGLQCCKALGKCGQCPYANDSPQGCDKDRLDREAYAVIEKMAKRIDEYRKMTRDIFEILERE